MVMLVSLQQASDHLRRDSDDDDNDLTLKIHAASQAVINYIDDLDFLDSAGDVELDSAGDPVGVPFAIQSATLILLGMLYVDRDAPDFRKGETNNPARTGEIILPKTVHFLLDPYRIPRLA